MRSTRAVFAALVSSWLWLAGGEARAQLSAGAAGGVAVPWDGDSGYSVAGDVMYRLRGKPWRFGGEFEFRKYKSEFFGVSGVEVEAYQMRILAHYLFALGPLVPYVGVGLHTSINEADDDEIELALPGRSVDGTGTGMGVTAIAGLEIPLADFLSLFAESRLGVEAQFSEEDDGYDDDDVEVENLGGFSGRGGIRIRF
jgi:hypothetical protein